MLAITSTGDSSAPIPIGVQIRRTIFFHSVRISHSLLLPGFRPSRDGTISFTLRREEMITKERNGALENPSVKNWELPIGGGDLEDHVAWLELRAHFPCRTTEHDVVDGRSFQHEAHLRGYESGSDEKLQRLMLHYI
jgi:hypothetical protein